MKSFIQIGNDNVDRMRVDRTKRWAMILLAIFIALIESSSQYVVSHLIFKYGRIPNRMTLIDVKLLFPRAL